MSFDQLRKANVDRCREIFHELDAWSPTDWMTGAAGEAGEVIEVLLLALTTISKSTLVANSVKKLRRIDDGTNQAKDPQSREEAINAIADELADSIIYQDLLAARLGIDLWQAIANKFNAVSEARGSAIRLFNGVLTSPVVGDGEQVTAIPSIEDIDLWHDRGDIDTMYIVCQNMAGELRSRQKTQDENELFVANLITLLGLDREKIERSGEPLGNVIASTIAMLLEDHDRA